MEGTITFKTNKPVQPWLCRHDPKKIYITWKEYRGRMEECKRPRWGPGVGCVPMVFVYDSQISFPLSWLSKLRWGENWLPDPALCSAIGPGAIAEYNAYSEVEYSAISAEVFQSYPYWFPNVYAVGGVRKYSAYVFPGSYSGHLPNDFVGCSFDVSLTSTVGWPGSAWSVRVLGNSTFQTAPVGVTVRSVVLACSFVPGLHYDSGVDHPDYFSMPGYPACESVEGLVKSYCGVSNVQLLLGEKWRWTYTFTPPYFDNWWVCFPGPDGGLYPAYPLGDKMDTPPGFF